MADLSKYKKSSIDLSAYKKASDESEELNYASAIIPSEVDRGLIAGGLESLQNTGNALADALHFSMQKAESAFPESDTLARRLGITSEMFKDQGQRKDFYKTMDVKDEPWYKPTGMAEILSKYFMPGEIGMAGSTYAGASRLIPKVISESKYGRKVPGMLDRAIAGALTDMLGSDKSTGESKALSAGVSAVLPPLVNLGIKGVAKATKLPDMIRNFILSQTEKSAERGSAHTPEQTAENITRNYMNKEGQMMPIDFGTATNMPRLESAYNLASKVPFSGGAEKANIIRNQMGDLSVNRAEQALADAEKYASEVRGVSDQEIARYRQEIPKLESEYKAANQAHEAHTELVNSAPKVVNSLINEIPKDVSLPEYLSNETRSAYSKLRSDAKQGYDALKESAVEFNPNIPGESKFPSYNQMREELEDARQSLSDTFGNDADMSAAIKKELNTSAGLIENQSGKPIKLADIREHTSNLGKLWEKAKNSGNDNLARVLMNMRRALVNDTKNLLRYNGNEAELNLWNEADKNWSDSAKFWETKAMRKVVGKNTTKRDYIAEADKLAKELHNPNNADVMAMLPENAKRASGHLLITKGKGLTRETNLSADEILSRLKSMTPEEFQAFSNHSPQEAKFLQELEGHRSNMDRLGESKKQLAKIIDRVKSPSGSQLESATGNISRRKDELEKAKNKRYESNKIRSTTGERIGQILTGGLTGIAGLTHPVAALPFIGGGVLSSRLLQKMLSDPKLIQAYVKGEKFPTKISEDLPDIEAAIEKYMKRNR